MPVKNDDVNSHAQSPILTTPNCEELAANKPTTTELPEKKKKKKTSVSRKEETPTSSSPVNFCSTSPEV